MPARKKWKVVTAGGESAFTSENKTYEWLRNWAAQQPDGATADVFVQEPPSERWMTFERHIVRAGLLDTH